MFSKWWAVILGTSRSPLTQYAWVKDFLENHRPVETLHCNVSTARLRKIVGWVEAMRYPTKPPNVGFRSSTQPTRVKVFGQNLRSIAKRIGLCLNTLGLSISSFSPELTHHTYVLYEIWAFEPNLISKTVNILFSVCSLRLCGS
jgi:hypothetical protein